MVQDSTNLTLFYPYLKSSKRGGNNPYIMHVGNSKNENS